MSLESSIAIETDQKSLSRQVPSSQHEHKPDVYMIKRLFGSPNDQAVQKTRLDSADRLIFSSNAY